MVVYSLYIMSKSGGLIFQRNFAETEKHMSSNEYLVLAGTFHSLHVIAKQLTPLTTAAIRASGAPTAAASAAGTTSKSGGKSGGKKGASSGSASVPQSEDRSRLHLQMPGSKRLMAHGDSGITVLEADAFKLHCYAPSTGTKFFLLASNGQQNCDSLLHYVYDLYADYVMKNPFYELEMPIHCSKFDQKLDAVVQDTTKKDSS